MRESGFDSSFVLVLLMPNTLDYIPVDLNRLLYKRNRFGLDGGQLHHLSNGKLET